MQWQCQMLVLTILPPSAGSSKASGSPGINGAAEAAVSRATVVNTFNMSTLYISMTWRWDGPAMNECKRVQISLSVFGWIHTPATLFYTDAPLRWEGLSSVSYFTVFYAALPLPSLHVHRAFLYETPSNQAAHPSPPRPSRRCVTFGAVFGVGVLHCEGGGRQWALLRQRPFSLRPLCKHIKKCLITAYTAAHPMTLSTPQRGQKGHPESGPRLMWAPMQIGFMHMRRN